MTFLWSLRFTILLCSIGVMLAATVQQQADIDSGKETDWAFLNSSIATSPNFTTTFAPSALASSQLSLSDASPVVCFVNRAGGPMYDFIDEFNFLGAIEVIVVDDDALDMRKWTFSAGQYKKMTQRPCRVAVGLNDQGPQRATVDFQSIAVAHLVARIGHECPWSKGTLGGYVKWGFKQEFMVVLGSKKGYSS